jgi:hypothetical protein
MSLSLMGKGIQIARRERELYRAGKVAYTVAILTRGVSDGGRTQKMSPLPRAFRGHQVYSFVLF